VEEDQRGLRVSPREGGGFSALVLLRRLHMSLDRKVEVLGAVELPAALVNLFTVRGCSPSGSRKTIKIIFYF
jgi:hypothetical protein